MAGSASTPPPRPPGSAQGGNVLTRKIGPAPVYVWALAAVAGYLLYRHFAGAAASPSAVAVAPSTGDTSGATGAAGTGGSGDSGAGIGGGGASPVDSLSADLISQLAGGLTGITGDLTGALINQQDVIAGFGAAALQSNYQLEQAIIASYTPQQTPATIATTPGAAAPATTAPTSALKLPSTVSGTIPVGSSAAQTAMLSSLPDLVSGSFTPAPDSFPSGPVGGATAAKQTQQGSYVISSGAGAVKSGATKTNYQAKARAV